MKLSKKLLLLSVLILTSISCSFTNKMQKGLLFSRVFGTEDTAASSPEILAEEILEDTLVWKCQANDLREYLGASWENYPTDLRDLVLEVTSKGDDLNYTLSFSDSEQLLVQRDPDYWPPPGATLVPEGEYEVETKFQASGSARLDDTLFQGTINVDYEVITHFPDPVINSGSLGYKTIGAASQSQETFDLCLNVLEEEYQKTIEFPELLRKNCRWPGYIFVCSPGQ